MNVFEVSSYLMFDESSFLKNNNLVAECKLD